MKFNKILTDEDFGLISCTMKNPRHRFGARGIVLNCNNQVAIMFKEKKNEYKLIGGGIEKGEDPKIAFCREVMEETGCVIEISEFLGTYEEVKSLDNFRQTSYIYLARVISDTKKIHYTEKEIVEVAQLLWCDVSKSISLLQNCENNLQASSYDGPKSIYHTKFIVRRDLEILKYWEMIN